MSTATATRPSRATHSPVKDWSNQIQAKGSGLPSRVILHGVESIGKTSFGACAPKPIFIQTRGETGLETLIDAGRLPEIPHFSETQSFEDLLSQIEWLTTSDHDHKSLVIDTLNGSERLCHELVVERDLKGQWGEVGFTGYQRGFEMSLADWRRLISALDGLRRLKKMGIIALAHTRVGPFKNPEGPDYDRYIPKMHEKTWSMSKEWADIVLFANFHTEVVGVDSKGRKGKGTGGSQRVMFTQRTAAFDAKNRHGLPEEIDMGESGADAWSNFVEALKTAKGGETHG